jgi:hypothetical protein
MRNSITLEKMKQYCRDRKIMVPATASRAELEAAIARSALHLQKIESENCFGFWEQDDMTCRFCNHEDDCFKAAIGTDKEKYFKALEREENPKLRFKDVLKKKTRRKK